MTRDSDFKAKVRARMVFEYKGAPPTFSVATRCHPAAESSGERSLREIAARYRALADEWTALAGVMHRPSPGPAIRADVAARLRRVVENESDAARALASV